MMIGDPQTYSVEKLQSFCVLNRATVLQMVTVLYFLPTMLCTVVFCLLFTRLNGICLRNLRKDCTLAL